MTAATGVTLQPDNLNDSANQLPDAQQTTTDATNSLGTMDPLSNAGSTSDAAGQASLADANAARGGDGAAAGGAAAGGAGCGGGADAGAAPAANTPAATPAAGAPAGGTAS